MLACKVDIAKIRESIENTVAKSATNSGLFTVIDNYVLIPKVTLPSLSQEVESHIDDVQGLYKDVAKQDPVTFLKEIAAQLNSSDTESATARKTAGDYLSNLAIRTFPVKSEIAPITSSPSVDYALDAVKKLSTPKADEVFKKVASNTWNVDKALRELQVQPEQRNLILTTGLSDKQAIIDALVNNYSFPIEVHTAINNDLYKGGYFAHPSVYGEWGVYDGQGNTFQSELTQGEAIKRAKELNDAGKAGTEVPTSHYANLTVPGGTNYTENNIRTPGIIPIQKGHAAFATNEDIGWTRTDERQWSVKAALNYMVQSGKIEKEC